MQLLSSGWINSFATELYNLTWRNRDQPLRENIRSKNSHAKMLYIDHPFVLYRSCNFNWSKDEKTEAFEYGCIERSQQRTHLVQRSREYQMAFGVSKLNKMHCLSISHNLTLRSPYRVYFHYCLQQPWISLHKFLSLHEYACDGILYLGINISLIFTVYQLWKFINYKPNIRLSTK